MPAIIPPKQTLATFLWSLVDTLLGINGMLAGWLEFPITFATANNAVLFTVPSGYRLFIEDAFWEPTVSFTGGASSAIGLSSSNAAYATAGDLLGGATGDVAAQLTATPTAPIKSGAGRTIGAKVATGVCLVAGDTIKFNQITSAFTAGAGQVHIKYRLLPAA